MLLLHKPRRRDAWQLPQGGVNAGETHEQAALRELREEAGIAARVVGRSDTVYRYDFPTSYRRFRPDNVCGQRIEYFLAVPMEGGRVRVDGKEIDRFAWATVQELGRYIRRKEYREMVRALVREGEERIENAKCRMQNSE